MDEIDRIEQMEPQCLKVDLNEYYLGQECSPDELNNLEIYNIEESKLVNYYDENRQR